jgi:hypothetical protein
MTKFVDQDAAVKIAVDYALVYMSENTHGDGRKCGEAIADAIAKLPTVAPWRSREELAEAMKADYLSAAYSILDMRTWERLADIALGRPQVEWDVEKAARVMCARIGAMSDVTEFMQFKPWESCPEEGRDEYRADALAIHRAGLAAPTDDGSRP